MNSSQFNLAVNEHSSALKTFALKFTNDLDDANDLIQDTMLKAVRFQHKFDSGTNIKGWLYVIMRNTFINNYRSNKKAQLIIAQTDEISSAQLLSSATNNGSQTTLVLGDINRALDKLPKKHSYCFIKYFEGYKYHEIAQELGIPLGTVKTRIFQAREMLKQQLKMYNK